MIDFVEVEREIDISNVLLNLSSPILINEVDKMLEDELGDFSLDSYKKGSQFDLSLSPMIEDKTNHVDLNDSSTKAKHEFSDLLTEVEHVDFIFG